MIVTYNKNGKPTFKLNKNATDILVFECLECGGEMFIENGNSHKINVTLHVTQAHL